MRLIFILLIIILIKLFLHQQESTNQYYEITLIGAFVYIYYLINRAIFSIFGILNLVTTSRFDGLQH